MATKVHQIRKEYGESFRSVVKGYAEMRYSRRLTAKILGINLSYFRQLLTRMDLHKHFLPQSQMRDVCKGGRSSKGGWPKGVPRNRGPKYGFEEMLAEVRKYPDRSIYETMADIHITTIYRHFGSFKNALNLSLWKPGETTYHYYQNLWREHWTEKQAA